jgi:C4-dicarboxylate-specific signal transduction histidine kinase
MDDSGTVAFWLEHIHPDDRPRILEAHNRLNDGKADQLAVEYRYLHSQRGLMWIDHLACVLRRNEAGRATHTVGVLRDITEQRRTVTEALELRSKLAHAGRVTLLGQLASALAHELSQPLGSILRNAEAAELMLQETAPDLEELRAIVADILRDDQRAGKVIDRLRSLLKRRTLDLLPVELDGVITEVLSLVGADAAARQVKFAYSADPSLPPVWGDRVHLQQVLLNLLVNAMDALAGTAPNDRCIQITARQAKAGMVEVRVCDNGAGIPDDSLEHLLEPFFTTKVNGMGMGLAVSKTIIEAHKGKIWAENRAGGGACFCFTLPAAGGEGEVAVGQ